MIFRCATCVFFSAHRPNWSDRPSSRGQCRRHAPVLDKEDDGRLRTLWPMVHEDAGCGEHAEIDVPVAPEQLIPPSRPHPHAEIVRATRGWECDNCAHINLGEDKPDRCFVCRSASLKEVIEA